MKETAVKNLCSLNATTQLPEIGSRVGTRRGLTGNDLRASRLTLHYFPDIRSGGATKAGVLFPSVSIHCRMIFWPCLFSRIRRSRRVRSAGLSTSMQIAFQASQSNGFVQHFVQQVIHKFPVLRVRAFPPTGYPQAPLRLPACSPIPFHATFPRLCNSGPFTKI